MTLPADYKSHYVCFIDILGFADKVAKLEENHALFEQIIKINSVFAKLGQEAQQIGKQLQDAAPNVNWSAFSDTIVISVPETRSRMADLYTAIIGTQRLCQRLLELGALARGGIAKGPLYHKDGILFGQGMIDAYYLEKNISKVPRIAVNPDVAIEWKQTYGNPQGLIALKELIRQDQDGIHFIDLFYFPENDDIDKETYNFFVQSCTVLNRLLVECDAGLSELSKVVWLAHQYNSANLLQRLRHCAPIVIPRFLGMPQ